MNNNTSKKKGNSAKKLIPAAGMLAVSASMLATSTYAWFTMSREVEVKNIQMTATVPEDLQISLGHLQYVAGGTTDVTQATASDFTGLSDNQGILKPATGNNADNGNVLAPLTGTDAISMLDWSSSADISQYYRLGKIMPASSTTGENIYFTPDAAGVGKSLKAGAAYYQAASLTSAFTWDTTDKTFKSGGSGGDSAMTTLHAVDKTTRAEDKWGTGEEAEGSPKYATAEEWYNTNDDGYYVDIPVWFRSSAKDELNLSVDAYVTSNAAKDNDDLYLAARAVILYNATPAIDATPAASSNLLRIRQDALTESHSIVDFMYSTNSTGDAVSAVDAAAKTATYGDATEYAGAQFIKVPAGASNGYGTPTKAIIRVWLEGEDPNCWNQNAGQNFNISLKFSKDALSESSNPATYPATSIDRANKKASTEDGSLQNGQRVTVNVGNTPADVLVFEYHSTATPKWDLIDGTFHTLEGKTYTFNNTNVTNSDQIAAQLEAMGTKAGTFASELTVTVGSSQQNP